jgi:putative alpha-1,2-mannosidase
LCRGAWFIQNAIGLYPLSPASGQYILGSPLFANVSISIDGGAPLNIVALNQGPGNVYVSSVSWNGAPVSGMYVSYSSLMQGGTLEFSMSSTPAGHN